MLRHRLIGVITVLDQIAVQSFGYKKYLPLGKPEVLVQNLDRWGADEIIIQCIDRSKRQLGPNFDLIERIGRVGVSTPIAFGGGISSKDHAVRAIQLGADRITVDSLMWRDPNEINKIANVIGSQALIANFPMVRSGTNFYWHDYVTSSNTLLDASTCKEIDFDAIGEIMISDVNAEGGRATFDPEFAKSKLFPNCPLILFGGITDVDQISELLSIDGVLATAIGNTLNYRETAIQAIKSGVREGFLRVPKYKTEFEYT